MSVIDDLLRLWDDALGLKKPPKKKKSAPQAAPSGARGGEADRVTKKLRPPARHVTIRGRVVYDRKRHFFKVSDATRILRRILLYDKLEYSNPFQLALELAEVLRTLLTLPPEMVTKTIRDQINSIIDYFLGLGGGNGN